KSSGGSVVVVVVVVVDVVVDVEVEVVLEVVDDGSVPPVVLALWGEPPPLKSTAEPETTAMAPTRPAPTRTCLTLTDRIATPAERVRTAGESARMRARLRKSHAK